MVTVTFVTRGSLEGAGVGQDAMGKSLVSKLYWLVWVRIADP